MLQFPCSEFYSFWIKLVKSHLICCHRGRDSFLLELTNYQDRGEERIFVQKNIRFLRFKCMKLQPAFNQLDPLI